MSKGLLEPPARRPLAPSPPSRPPLLLGDEAVALGALHAGISAAYGYPGTPSTEIFETLVAHADDHGVVAHWCTNEKTAYEQALGASMVGTRVLVSMKHVGLNVAMDPFVNSALVRIHGGLVVVVADDPGMHSSQNEQDSRVLADFARVPCLEPANQQEAYDMTRAAFAASERLGLPVLVRMVTRLCHGRAEVSTAPATSQSEARKIGDAPDWTLLPGNARRLWQELLDGRDDVRTWSAECGWSSSGAQSEVGELGIVTAGIARNYLDEVLPDPHPSVSRFHVGAHPAPDDALRKFAGSVDRILVLEDGYPYLERRLRGALGAPLDVAGKDTGQVPQAGELTPEAVRKALGLRDRPELSTPLSLPMRPPQLCRGCPHADAFRALRIALADHEQAIVTGDIGCYALGALPPYDTLESCVCMGASIGMAKGAADVGAGPTVAVIGDSTFLHSGLTPLVDASAHDANLTVLILDNGTIAMTGQQPTALPPSRLEPLLRGIGIHADHLHVMQTHPKRVDELADILRREVEHSGLSVVVAARECLEAVRKDKAARRRSEEGSES
jgi:indolepyruvate ferredoxin oxidoreductase alpha subunit